MPGYIGAIDQGTTSTRFIVFDRTGRVISAAQQEHEQIYPQPGWVEHDPREIWRRTQSVIAEAMSRRELRASDLAAIGITNQRETTIVWDRRTGEPVYNAIVWQDVRVADYVAEFASEGGEGSGHDRLRVQTGLPLTTYFSGLKVRWILDHVPGVREKAEAGEVLFGTVDAYLAWLLTGEHVTDVTNASRTQLMNLATLDWDPEILNLFDIPRAILPRIASSSEIHGLIGSGLIGSGLIGSGLIGRGSVRVPELAGVPLAGILGDQQAALLGQTCFRPGEAKNTYGTGCFLLMNTGERPVPSRHGLLTTVAYKLGPAPAHYALEGSVAIAGALVQWLRDNLGLIESSAEIEPLARSVKDNGGVYFVPAFSGLFAPYWKENARGVIAGLTRYVNKGHLARAVLEATAFQTREVVEAIEKDSGIRLDVLRVDGGMVSNELLMQFQADIADRPVVRPAVQETTALGAAFAAGLATGFFSGVEELREQWRQDRSWTPRMDAAEREYLYAQWKKAVTRSFDWV